MRVSNSAAVRVLAVDPALGSDLSPADLAAARQTLVADQHDVPRGPWHPREHFCAEPGMLGLLVTQGVLLREIAVGQHPSAELMAPGHLLRPWDTDDLDASVPAHTTWTALESTRLAILDRAFAQTAARWPELSGGLICRALTRTRYTAFSLALTNLPRLDHRLLGLLWAMADHWGKVRPDGILVPFRLSHQTLGRLVSARRPSVTRTIRQLENDGRLQRTPNGCWLLHGESPALALPRLHVAP